MTEETTRYRVRCADGKPAVEYATSDEADQAAYRVSIRTSYKAILDRLVGGYNGPEWRPLGYYHHGIWYGNES